MRRTETVNDPSRIAAHSAVLSVNAAMQVDLFAQSNASFVNNRIHSGFGGQPDFVTGSLHSTGGHAVIALHAWHQKTDTSTVVPLLDNPVTSFQHSAIVSEHGCAELFGRFAARPGQTDHRRGGRPPGSAGARRRQRDASACSGTSTDLRSPTDGGRVGRRSRADVGTKVPTVEADGSLARPPAFRVSWRHGSIARSFASGMRQRTSSSGSPILTSGPGTTKTDIGSTSPTEARFPSTTHTRWRPAGTRQTRRSALARLGVRDGSGLARRERCHRTCDAGGPPPRGSRHASGALRPSTLEQPELRALVPPGPDDPRPPRVLRLSLAPSESS